MKILPALLLLLAACTNPFGGYDADEMRAVVTNRSGQTAAKVGLYARQTVGNREASTDSALAYNLGAVAVQTLALREDRVQPTDGGFLLVVTLENGAVLAQRAGYFTNGIFLNRAIEFDVQADTIRVVNVVQ